MNMIYKGVEYTLIENDKNCTRINHCELCAFSKYCDDYINKFNHFACGCDFHAEPIYFIKL